MKFKIGDKVQHTNAGWKAKVKGVVKPFGYILADKKIGEIMGIWGDRELKKVR